MRSPADPVDRSKAESGEVADAPDNIKIIEPRDEDDEIVGIAIRWDSAACWIWANASSYQSLEEAR